MATVCQRDGIQLGDGGEDREHDSVGFVEIFEIFSMQNDFVDGAAAIDRVYLYGQNIYCFQLFSFTHDRGQFKLVLFVYTVSIFTHVAKRSNDVSPCW